MWLKPGESCLSAGVCWAVPWLWASVCHLLAARRRCSCLSTQALHSARHRDAWWVGCLPDRSYPFLRVGRLADNLKLQRGNKRGSHCGQSVHVGQNSCRFYLVQKNKRLLFCSPVFSYPGSPWRVLLNIITCGRLQTDTYSRWTRYWMSNMY